MENKEAIEERTSQLLQLANQINAYYAVNNSLARMIKFCTNEKEKEQLLMNVLGQEVRKAIDNSLIEKWVAIASSSIQSDR